MRALHGSGAGSVEAAVAWIMDHENDADLDEPLLVPKARPTAICSPPLPSATPFVGWFFGALRRPCYCALEDQASLTHLPYRPHGVQGPPPKPKLSAEEARKQAEEKVRKAKERREVRLCACAPDVYARLIMLFLHLSGAAVTKRCCNRNACLLCKRQCV